mmetsp:Transcript_36674/g.85321  ORF Transcript_36674/g.85321 Transcript_36674/m.85321 type:complete len:196 (-) Transcript_36674:73-660(-)
MAVQRKRLQCSHAVMTLAISVGLWQSVFSAVSRCSACTAFASQAAAVRWPLSSLRPCANPCSRQTPRAAAKARRRKRESTAQGTLRPRAKSRRVPDRAAEVVAKIDEMNEKALEEGAFMDTLPGQLTQGITVGGIVLLILWEVYVTFFVERKTPTANPLRGAAESAVQTPAKTPAQALVQTPAQTLDMPAPAQAP